MNGGKNVICKKNKNEINKLNHDHCCDEMDYFLQENKVAIYYNKRFRRYSINFIYGKDYEDINYCPWCGKKLKNNLNKEYNIELAKIFDSPENIIFDIFFESRIPSEFKTDEWWKKRGL